jgi:hypothetical protein
VNQPHSTPHPCMRSYGLTLVLVHFP